MKKCRFHGLLLLAVLTLSACGTQPAEPSVSMPQTSASESSTSTPEKLAPTLVPSAPVQEPFVSEQPSAVTPKPLDPSTEPEPSTTPAAITPAPSVPISESLISEQPSTVTPEPLATSSELLGYAPAEITVGVAGSWYLQHRPDVFSTIDTQAIELGVTLDVVDDQGSYSTQQEQIDTFLAKGVDVIMIDSSVGGMANRIEDGYDRYLLEKAKADDVPVVFIDSEPAEETLQSYDKVWHVGTKYGEERRLSVEIIVDYFNAHPEADKGGDKHIRYIEFNFPVYTPESPLKVLSDAGFTYEVLNYTNPKHLYGEIELIDDHILSSGIENIEALITYDDETALKLIGVLKSHGYNTGDSAKYIPVVGGGATAPALEAIRKGELLGTTYYEVDEHLGKAAINIAAALAQGQEITENTIGYEITDGKHVWIPYVKITAENVDDFQ